MKWNKLYNYPKTIRSSVDGVRKYDVNNEKLPSVTTILSSTQDASKAESLAKWKAKVGEVEAERIKNTAATRGTAMHSYLEHYIKGGLLIDLTSGMNQPPEVFTSSALRSVIWETFPLVPVTS